MSKACFDFSHPVLTEFSLLTASFKILHWQTLLFSTVNSDCIIVWVDVLVRYKVVVGDYRKLVLLSASTVCFKNWLHEHRDQVYHT